MRRYQIITVCLIVLFVFSVSCVHSSNEFIGKNVSDNYVRTVMAFKSVMLSKDAEGFLEFIWPPGREIFKTGLTVDSMEYNSIFGENDSLRSYLKRMREYEIVKYADKPGDNVVNVFDVIFYDKSQVKSLKGKKLEELHGLGYDNKILVFFFYQPAAGHEPPGHIKGQWYVELTHGYFWSRPAEDLVEYYPIK